MVWHHRSVYSHRSWAEIDRSIGCAWAVVLDAEVAAKALCFEGVKFFHNYFILLEAKLEL